MGIRHDMGTRRVRLLVRETRRDRHRDDLFLRLRLCHGLFVDS